MLHYIFYHHILLSSNYLSNDDDNEDCYLVCFDLFSANYLAIVTKMTFNNFKNNMKMYKS